MNHHQVGARPNQPREAAPSRAGGGILGGFLSSTGGRSSLRILDLQSRGRGFAHAREHIRPRVERLAIDSEYLMQRKPSLESFRGMGRVGLTVLGRASGG